MPVTVSSPAAPVTEGATPANFSGAAPAPVEPGAPATPDLPASDPNSGEKLALDFFDSVNNEYGNQSDLPAGTAPQGNDPVVEVQPGQAAPVVAQPAPPVQPVVPPVAPVVEPSPAAAPVVPTPAQPVVQQPAAGAEPQPAAQPAAQGPSDPFREMNEAIAGAEAQFTDAVAKQYYQISNEDMNAFLGGDGTKMSQAMARVHVNAVRSVMAVVSAQMPRWVNTLLEVRKMDTDREESFWAANPGLDRSKHRQFVVPVARTYMQSNPNAAPASINKMVGMLVAAAAGLDPMAAFTAPGANNQQPAVPQQSQVRTPGPVVRQVPQAFAPAGAGAAPANGATPPANPWEDFVRSVEQGGM